MDTLGVDGQEVDGPKVEGLGSISTEDLLAASQIGGEIGSSSSLEETGKDEAITATHVKSEELEESKGPQLG